MRYFYIGQKVWRNPDNCEGKVTFVAKSIVVEWENGLRNCYSANGSDDSGIVIVSQKPIQPIANIDLGNWEIGDEISFRLKGLEYNNEIIEESSFEDFGNPELYLKMKSGIKVPASFCKKA